MPLDAQIEAILFWKGDPVSLEFLEKCLGKERKEIEDGLKGLKEKLEGRGVSLIQNGDKVMLGTAPSVSSLIEKLIKENLERDLGKAGLETLSIVLYRAPVSRKDIDYIRGVNSSFILRELIVRGLVERVGDTEGRSYHYGPSMELIQHLGLRNIEELPRYQEVRSTIQSMEKESKAKQESPAQSE